jgi:hypothetical protein
MEIRTFIQSGLLALVLPLSGCSGADPSAISTAPSPAPPQATAPPPAPPNPRWPPADYTLTAASLSGVVYESTPAGRVPIPGAVLYCELCGEATHTWATADANGVYRFPGDLARGGGVWLAPGRLTPVQVGGVGFGTETWIGRSLEVLIAGDTWLDIALVRR